MTPEQFIARSSAVAPVALTPSQLAAEALDGLTLNPQERARVERVVDGDRDLMDSLTQREMRAVARAMSVAMRRGGAFAR